MRKIIFTFIAVLLAANIAHAQTTPRGFHRLDNDLQKARADVNGGVWTVGSNGGILSSGDNGNTWKQHYSGTAKTLIDIGFAASKRVFAIGLEGAFLRSDDAGDNWSHVPVQTNLSLGSIAISGESIIVAGESGIIFRSSNNGDSWQQLPKASDLAWIYMSWADEVTLIGANARGAVLRSVDKGDTWSEVYVPPFGVTAMTPFAHSFDKKTIFASITANGMHSIISSSDKGQTWQAKEVAYPIKALDYTYHRNGVALKEKMNASEYGLFLRSIADSTTEHEIRDTNYAVVRRELYSFAFTDSLHGVACGAFKNIYATDDGGMSWTLRSYMSMPLMDGFTALHFLNDTVGYIGGGFTTVLKTKNGGATWLPQRRSVGYSRYIKDIHFIDEKNGIIQASGGLLLFTRDGGETYFSSQDIGSTLFSEGAGIIANDTSNIRLYGTLLQESSDGGRTWKRKNTFGSDSVSSIYTSGYRIDNKLYLPVSMKDPQKRYGNVSYSALYLSDDLGVTWRHTEIPYTNGLGSPYFFNKDTGVISGTKYIPGEPRKNYMLRTEDGGNTWSITDSNRIINTVHTAFHGDKGYSVGSFGLILVSKDRGRTWDSLDYYDPEAYLSKVSMPSENTTYIISSTNMLFKSVSVPDSVTSIAANTPGPTIQGNDLWMKEAYPNPSSGTITLKLYYSLAMNRSEIKLSVYSMTGEKVADITENFRQSTGNNPALVQWNTQGLPGGMYIIEAKGGNAQMAIPVVIAR